MSMYINISNETTEIVLKEDVEKLLPNFKPLKKQNTIISNNYN